MSLEMWPGPKALNVVLRNLNLIFVDSGQLLQMEGKSRQTQQRMFQ